MTSSSSNPKSNIQIHEQVDEAMRLSFDMFCVVDFDGNFIDLNPAWQKTLGWSPEEMYAKPFIEFVHPEDRATTQTVTENHTNGRLNAFRFENRYLHKDGSYRRLQWNSSTDLSRKIITAVARDITNERLSEEMFETAFQSGPQPMLITGIHGRILKCNLAFSRSLGFAREELSEIELGFRSHPEEVERDLGILKKMQLGEILEITIDKRYKDKSGQWISFEVTAKTILDAAGKPKYIVSLLKDLTKESTLEDCLEKTSQTLMESRNFLKGTIDKLPSLVSYIDKDFKYKFVNAAYMKWFNVSAEQCLNHKISEVIGEVAYAQVYPEMTKVFHGEAQEFERIVKYKNGEQKFLHVSFTPDFDTDGSVKGFYNIVDDITKIKETEITLAQTVKAIESSSIMSTSDPSGKITFANDNFSKISGYKNSELLGKDHRILNSKTHSKEFFKKMWDTVLAGKVWTGEVCNQAKDGSKYWVQSSVAPIYDIHGNIAQLMSVRFDISDRKKTERMLAKKTEDLEKKERLLNKILDGIPSPIAHWDSNQRNLHANKAFMNFYSKPGNDIAAKSIREIRGESYFAANQEHIKNVLSGTVQTFETEHSLADGNMRQTINSYIPDIENGIVQGFFSIATDVTELKRLESEKNEAQTRMTNSAKMSSLGEMAGGIAHEINNPLAVILGKAGQLKRKIEAGGAEKETLLENVAKIESTAQRIVKIIKGLSAFSRNAESDPMEKAKLTKIAEDTIELCSEKYKNKGVLLKTLPFPDIEIECRAAQISQVILNLLNNANDAVSELPEKWVLLEIKQKHDKVMISVTDSGNGIPQNILEKLMQPFFTTKGVGKGTGLGLSVSKSIVEIHHGKLSYDSDCPNTRFVIELPISQSQFQAHSPKKAA